MGRNVSLSHSDPSRRDYPVTCEQPLPVELCAGGETALIGTVYVVPPNTFPAEYSGDQTNVTVITPTAGKRLQIIGVYVTSDDGVFDFKLDFATSVITVARMFESNQLGSTIPMNLTGATDEVLNLNISDSTGSNWYVLINYAEVD